MEERTRTELGEAVDLIQDHLGRLLVETELLKQKLRQVEVLPDDDDPDDPGPDPPPPEAGGGPDAGADPPTGGVVGPREVRVSGLGTERPRVLGLRGYEGFSSIALDPYVEMRFVYPTEVGDRFRPILQLADIAHVSHLPAQLRLLGEMPLLEGVSIAAPGTSGEVEAAVRDVLEGDQDYDPDSIDFLGFADE